MIRASTAATLVILIASSALAAVTESEADSKAAEAKGFPAQVIETEQPRYSGELITLSLKDADIKDVVKTFAVLTDLNFVVDPSVSGSVTLELRNVPWDQAFEIILEINGLHYHMDNNVVYIAPLAKLARMSLR